MSRAKSVEELKQDLQAAEEQYKRLLDKNQDDLISIKQREVQVKKAMEGIDAERSQWAQWEAELHSENQLLKRQLNEVKERKGGDTSDMISLQDKNIQLDSRMERISKENNEMSKRLKEAESKQEQIGKRLAQKENELLESEEIFRRQKDQYERLVGDQGQLRQELLSLQSQVSQSGSKFSGKSVSISLQTEETHDRESEYKINLESKLIQYQSQLEIHTARNCKDIELKDKRIECLSLELSKSIDQLKLLASKNKAIMEDNSTLKKHCLEADDALQKTKGKLEEEKRKLKEIAANNLNNTEAVGLVHELQQENKILKEMIKSVKTMVRVREVEIEKYKNKLNVEAEEKIHRSEQRKVQSQTPGERRPERKLPKIR